MKSGTLICGKQQQWIWGDPGMFERMEANLDIRQVIKTAKVTSGFNNKNQFNKIDDIDFTGLFEKVSDFLPELSAPIVRQHYRYICKARNVTRNYK